MRLLWTFISLAVILNEVERCRANQIWKDNEVAKDAYRPANFEALQITNDLWDRERLNEDGALSRLSNMLLEKQGWFQPLKRQVPRKDDYEVFRLRKRRVPSKEEMQEGFRLKKGDPKLDLDEFRLKRGDHKLDLDEFRLKKGDPKLDLDEFRLKRGDPKLDLDEFRLKRGDPKLDLDDFRLKKGDPKLDLDEFRLKRGDPKLDLDEFRLKKDDPKLDLDGFRLKKGDTKMDHEGFRLKKSQHLQAERPDESDPDDVVSGQKEVLMTKRNGDDDNSVEGFRLRKRQNDLEGFRLRKRWQDSSEDGRHSGYFKLEQRNFVSNINEVPNIFRLGK